MLLRKKLVIIALLFVVTLSTISYAQSCETENVRQVLRKILYLYFTEPQSVPLPLAEVKDLLVFYLSVSSQDLTTDCSTLGTTSNKPIFEIMDTGEDLPEKIPVCNDETKYGECSKFRPAYCYAGVLYQKCDLCGCPANSVCGRSNKCESLSQNITCFQDFDCGQNSFAGNYFCSNNYISRTYINYSCINPGTTSSQCMSATSTILLNYCNPSLNQICVNGEISCSKTTNVTKPANLTLEGSDGTWCYDSDGNGAYFGKGYCTDNNGTYYDFCNVDTVRDYYCTGTWNGLVWSNVKCEHGGYVCTSGGYICTDGACKVQTNVTNQTMLPAPTYLEVLWGAGGTAPSYTGVYTQNIRFVYNGSLSNVASFRLYQKKPGENQFSLAAEFVNPSTIPSCSSTLPVNSWSLRHPCTVNFWEIGSGTYTSSSFPVGEYSYYIAAVNTGNIETTSQVASDIALDKITILSPIGPQATSTPTIKWTVASGWPINPSYWIRVYNDTVGWTNPSVYVSLGSSEGSTIYNGPALDPTKAYTVYIHASMIQNGKNYVSMVDKKQTFWIGNQTVSVSPTGVCLVRDFYTGVPSFYAPDAGVGYVKKAIPGVNTDTGLLSACNNSTYSELMKLYCTQNSNPMQQYRATYRSTGDWLSAGCGTNGCSYHFCNYLGYPPPNSGVCILGDGTVDLNFLPFWDPDIGKGYAKMTKNGINTIASLQSACTKDDYKFLLQKYCTQNSGRAQEIVITYGSGGGAATFACSNGALSCDAHFCQELNQTVTSTNQTSNQTNTTIPSTFTLQGSDGTWCYDPDGSGSVDIYAKRYCQDNNGLYDDYCETPNLLRDGYCTGTWNGVSWSNVKCEFGGYGCTCLNGACT